MNTLQQSKTTVLCARLFVVFVFLFISRLTFAQPANNDCSNAQTITVSNGGYGLGIFTSTTDDISQATIQTGETFAPAILVASQNKKSMWYKFTIPTTRAVRITLLQPGTAITAGNAGFAVYKTPSCLPTNANISSKLTPIGTFGNTYHPCVDSGQYLIQVSSNSAANGPLYIQLQISDSTGALYDHPAQAYNFGVVTPHARYIDYTIGCQSIEDASEVCSVLQNASQYHKSSWHTFTTPAYFDYVSILLSNTSSNYFANYNVFKKFGYQLYKGNAVTTPISSLIKVDGCDSLLTDGVYAAYKMYRCADLEPNTTYSIQLFAHETFNSDIRLGIASGGTTPTQAPTPVLTNFPASNNFGILKTSANGIQVNLTDYLACNSNHAVTICPPALPVNGVVFNNKRYNLSSFFTFTLNAPASIDFYAYSTTPTSCGPGLLVRLFKQGLTNNCADLLSANLIGSATPYFTQDCLEPGNYTVQVSGTDTVAPYNYFYYGTTTSNSAQCLASNLGSKFNLRLTTYSRIGFNKYSLKNSGASDTINRVGGIMLPLANGTSYQAKTDTFGCTNTVRPSDTTCSPANTKVMYRQFAVADSGIVNFTTLSYPLQYRLYKGDANALATSHSAYTYPAQINGLTAQTKCMDYYVTCYTYNNACVTPGSYTFTTFGADRNIGTDDRPTFTFDIVNTKHYSPQTAQDMGSILDSVPATGGSKTSDIDYFSCKDNAVPINGYTPCKISNIAATKAIYRQFYLKDDALVSITGNGYCGFLSGVRTLFYGKATDGLAGLTPLASPWTCFSSASSNSCQLLAAGWYTVVSYGSGPTYDNPLQNVNQAGSYGSYIGHKDEFTITVTICPSPKYNRPYKASVNTTTKQPHLIEWKNRKGSTAAYPITDTIYTLPTENFNCVDDTPFNLHPIIACDTTMKKVAYYVFKTTQETYLQIDTKNFWGMVYALDVRTDSALFATATPIQPCVKGTTKMQLCRVPAGTYTLVIFAPSSSSCSGVTPQIYVDQVQESRFDHAKKAYDFGIVPPDSVWHNGKVGDINPLNSGRAPSNDFFYCTTGARPTDPANAMCMAVNNANMYDATKKYMYQGNLTNDIDIVRRNLWYTFVIDKPGRVRVKVENKTSNKNDQYRYAVYSSNVDGSLDFSTVVSSGVVDSTTAQGLSLVVYNGVPNYCNGTLEVNFYRDPCTQFAPQRYYVLVENRNPYWYDDADAMNPNSQAEVSILLDSINQIPTKYDHYYKAYDFGSVGVGTHTGGTDNFSCATRGSKDPISGNAGCTKTLWYKFTSTVTGNVRYRIKVNGVIKYTSSDLQLFQEDIAGDSTSKGLIYQTGTTFFDNTTNTYWTQHCVSPGTWYLILPGCNQVNENVFPEIQLLEQEGDFCTRPVVTTLSGAGSTISSVIVNCHTIGTDYGEFNPTLTCPVNGITNKYKSSWFRLDITGKDSLDVTAYLSENTNVNPSDIKYRLMTGNCGAMQEQSCVLDAQTQNTYKCLTAGSYYFQVFTPVTTTPTGSTLVTGDIKLNLSAISHADTCAPINNCLANSNFIPQFNCTTDSAVRFVNYSTFGSSIKYQWDFGYAGQTSSAISPSFNYPKLSTSQTYNATLKMQNIACGGRDSVTIPITIPPRPKFELGKDTSLCNGGSITLNATTWTGATYLWSTGATTPTITTTGTGAKTYWVRVTYNGCMRSDTIRVYINSIISRKQSKYLCGNDSVQLVSTRNLGEEHLWSTGSTASSIYADTAGTYINEMDWNGCLIKDTFNVFAAAHPLGNDTAICLKLPYQLKATSPGVTTYQWQNGTTAATFNVSTPGLYWVKLNYGNCNITDSINITSSTAIIDSTDVIICSGQTYILPSGKVKSAAGFYTDTLKYKTGCDSLITTTNLSITSLTQSNINAVVCAGQSYKLPWGITVNTSGIYSDIQKGITGCDSIRNIVNLTIQQVVRTNTAAVICARDNYTLPSGLTVNTAGVYIDTLRYRSGCDSLITSTTLAINTPIIQSISAAICEGKSYTLPSGMKVTAAGVYRDTVRLRSGCDSMISDISLSINKVTKQNTIASLCGGATYTLPSGIIVNSAGIYTDTLRYASGCDSVIRTVNLTVKTATLSTTTVTICSKESYTLQSGVKVNTTGTYADTLRYLAGCDSVISTINLTVKPSILQSFSTTICDGQTYTLPSGKTVKVAGTYNDTIKYVSGCDSLVSIIVLDVKPSVRSNISVSICDGAMYRLPSGVVVSTSGVYADTVRYRSGCDSVITSVDLILKKLTKVTISIALCAGQSYTLPSSIVVSTSGIYTDTVHYTSGCDSIISTVNISVKPLVIINKTAAICAGQSYTLPSGKIVNTTGTYNDTVRYIFGCDSLITKTNLTVKTVTKNNILAAICEGSNYTLPSGIIVTRGGIYADTLRYPTGCDSLIRTVNLSVKIVTRLTYSASVCAGQSYKLPSGISVNTPGVYIDTVRYSSGCDSLISNINLTIKPVIKLSIRDTICASTIYTLPSGKVVSTSGVYNDTLRYAAGCDSIIYTVALYVFTSQTVNTTATICAGQSFTMPSGLVVSSAGLHRDTIRNLYGCDSLITNISLTVLPRPVFGISPQNAFVCLGDTATLTALGGDSYQWSVNGAPLSNTAVIKVAPTIATSYKAVITQFSCNIKDSVTSTVSISPRPVVQVSKSNDIDCVIGTANLSASGGNKYLWSPAAFINNSLSANPVVFPTATTRFHVLVTSARGCVAEDSIEVKVMMGNVDNGFPMASAFTPNNDGVNDCFGVKSWGYVYNLDFAIYDRNGHLLFQTSDPSKCWDGTYKGEKLASAAYIYQVSARTICGDVYRKGTVVLIR